MDRDRSEGSEMEPAGVWAELAAQFDGGSFAGRMPRWTPTKLRQSKGTRWLWAELTAQFDGFSLDPRVPRWTPTDWFWR